jgi:hypothetical protein
MYRLLEVVDKPLVEICARRFKNGGKKGLQKGKKLQVVRGRNLFAPCGCPAIYGRRRETRPDRRSFTGCPTNSDQRSLPYLAQVFLSSPCLPIFSQTSPTLWHFGQLFLIGSSPCPPCLDFSYKLQTPITFDPLVRKL